MREVISRRVETYLAQNGSDVFQEWLDGLTDRQAKVLIDKTIAKMRLGNLSDHKSVGEGVQEVRLDYGPGYRLYFAEHGNTLIILLCGGTKTRQRAIVDRAKRFWKDWKERTLK